MAKRCTMGAACTAASKQTAGVPRMDDRRVISGIVVALQSGGRWIDVPAEYGPRKTLYNRFVRWSAQGRIWQHGVRRPWPPPMDHQPLCCSTARTCQGTPLRCRWEKGRSKPRQSASAAADAPPKIHALSNGLGRPLAFVLTGVAKRLIAVPPKALLQGLAPATLVMADRAYDTNTIRQADRGSGCRPEHPAQAHPPLEEAASAPSSTATAMQSSACFAD